MDWCFGLDLDKLHWQLIRLIFVWNMIFLWFGCFLFWSGLSQLWNDIIGTCVWAMISELDVTCIFGLVMMCEVFFWFGVARLVSILVWIMIHVFHILVWLYSLRRRCAYALQSFFSPTWWGYFHSSIYVMIFSKRREWYVCKSVEYNNDWECDLM